MARKGLDARCDRLMDTLLPPGTMAHREYHLAPEHRAALDNHRRRSTAIIDRLEKQGSGSWFAALLDGDPAAQVPPMSVPLSVALKLPEPPTLTPDMSDAQVARAWNRYAQGDEE